MKKRPVVQKNIFRKIKRFIMKPTNNCLRFTTGNKIICLEERREEGIQYDEKENNYTTDYRNPDRDAGIICCLLVCSKTTVVSSIWHRSDGSVCMADYELDKEIMKTPCTIKMVQGVRFTRQSRYRAGSDCQPQNLPCRIRSLFQEKSRRSCL